MKTLWTVLFCLGLLSGAVFLVFATLAETGLLADNNEPMAYSSGVTALVIGVFCLRGAAGKATDRDKSGDMPLGRLTSFAIGFMFCAGGIFFLGHVWLTDTVPGLLLFGAGVVGFVLVLAGGQLDQLRFDSSQTAIRRRGWLRTSRRADDELPADEVHRRQAARETLRRSIQGCLTGKITSERFGGRYRHLVDPARDLASPTDWPEFADEWRAFRSAATEGDEVWGFSTVSARDGRDCGEEGFALLRDGTVVDWFTTAVVG
jgi:hypothetical protein